MKAASLLLLALAWQAPPNSLSSLERQAGWELLFDGETSAGWHAFGREGARGGEGSWEVSDGCLHLPAGGRGGDLVTDRDFGDFELELEWRVAPGANSGIKYRVPETAGAGSMLGPEYQVLDDAAHPDAGKGTTSAGALYALYAPGKKTLRPAREFNHTRIVARGDRIEHWLNGVRVVECTVGSDDWEARREASKFAPHDDFGGGPGRIGLQDHGDEVWYRSIRVRDLGHLPGTPIELFDGESLSGWKEVGDARWSVDDDCILGEVGGGGQSFLITERTFGDFLLEVELKNELPGNSGIQVRSHVDDRGRVYGYQIEIDASARAWSGGLYDEGRRAWLDDLSDNEAAREAFRPGEWNRYRIECLGPWIRTWVNGVPAADWLDPLDLEGFIGLQVHSGRNTRVRWRNLRLRDLGTRSWERVDATADSGIDHFNARDRWGSSPDDWPWALTARLPDDVPALRLELVRTREFTDPIATPWPGFVYSVASARQLWDFMPSSPPAGVDWRSHSLVVSHVGDRIEVHVSGQRAEPADLVAHDLEAPLPTLSLSHGDNVEVQRIERLGPPR